LNHQHFNVSNFFVKTSITEYFKASFLK